MCLGTPSCTDKNLDAPNVVGFHESAGSDVKLRHSGPTCSGVLYYESPSATDEGQMTNEAFVEELALALAGVME